MHFNRKQFFTYISIIIVFLILSIAIFLGVRNQSQAFHFQDETDHVAVGWMMHRFDKKLYTDLSTNHQPLPILVGATFTKVIPYVTLFDLIERLRLSMFLYTMVWGLILSFRFRWRGVFSYALTYSVGYYFFAWHVLAESLAAPATIFVFLLLFEKLFVSEKKVTTHFSQRFDAISSGIAFTVMISTLLPLWPVCLLAGLALLYLFNKHQRMLLLISGLLSIGIIFLFFSPLDWFRETISNNILYFLPSAPKMNTAHWITIILYPFTSFLKPMDKLAQMISIPLILSGGVLMFRLSKKKTVNKKYFISGGFLYLLLILSNPRVLSFPIAFYQGFHLFPFIGAFFALFASFLWYLLPYTIKQRRTFGFIVLLSVLVFYNLSWARKKTDKLNEYYVQYGTHDSYARLMSVFKTEGDTFFSGPNGQGYMNMRADIPIAGRQLFHLQWAYESPELRKEFHDLLAQHPPTFIYFLEDQSGYHNDLQAPLKAQYTEIIQDKHRTFFYMLNSKVTGVTAEQQRYLDEQNFHFRTAAEVEIY